MSLDVTIHLTDWRVEQLEQQRDGIRSIPHAMVNAIIDELIAALPRPPLAFGDIVLVELTVGRPWSGRFVSLRPDGLVTILDQDGWTAVVEAGHVRRAP